MSLISDALKKAQRERTGSSSGAAAPLRSPTLLRRGGKTGAGKGVWVFANIAVLFVALIGGFAYFHRPVAPFAERPIAAHEITESPLPPPVAVVPMAPNSSAVTPPSLPASSAPRTPEYDLAGMTVVGPNTLLSISRRSDKRSIWIPVGKTVGEVTAVSYDPRTDRAVIEIDGRTTTIKMRDGSSDEPKIQAAE